MIAQGGHIERIRRIVIRDIGVVVHDIHIGMGIEDCVYTPQNKLNGLGSRGLISAIYIHIINTCNCDGMRVNESGVALTDTYQCY